MGLPNGVTLLGYGGMAAECETQVFMYKGLELRVPFNRCTMTLEEIEETYMCQSASTVDEGVATIDELLEELEY